MAKRKKSAGKKPNPQNVTRQETGSAPAATGAATETAASPKTSAATISRKEMLREAALNKRRQQNIWVAVGGVVIVALIGVAIYIGYRNSLPVVGETTFSTQGNLHMPSGTVSSSEYNSTPPTSGPHYETIASWGFRTDNVRYENLLHNLEDGGVAIYYQCEDGCPEVVAELEVILEPYFASGRHVILVRNDPNWVENGQPMHKDMGARLALTAWRKLLVMDEVDAETIRAFVEKYEGVDHHRG